MILLRVLRRRGGGQGGNGGPGAASVTLPGSPRHQKGNKELARTVVGLSPVQKEKNQTWPGKGRQNAVSGVWSRQGDKTESSLCHDLLRETISEIFLLWFKELGNKSGRPTGEGKHELTEGKEEDTLFPPPPTDFLGFTWTNQKWPLLGWEKERDASSLFLSRRGRHLNYQSCYRFWTLAMAGDFTRNSHWH